jgi:HTH-type transcriptional regulator / antitoxin HipB
MAPAFPVRFPGQLRQYLRALRNARGLTQARLGALVGVSQARIAEIEANPGLVSFEQLMKLLAVLGVTLSLRDEALISARTSPVPEKVSRKPRAAKTRSRTAYAPSVKAPGRSEAKAAFVARQKKGSW